VLESVVFVSVDFSRLFVYHTMKAHEGFVIVLYYSDHLSWQRNQL